MAIPKKYKKQIKAAMAGQPPTTVTRKNAAKTKRKKTWSLKVGDLVENGVMRGDLTYCFLQAEENG